MKPRNSTPFRSHASITAAFSVALFSHFAAPAAFAATRYWDGGSVDIAATGNGSGAGGDGTWNTTIKNWDQGNGLAHVAWVNANNDVADWVTGTSNITLGTDITLGGINQKAGGGGTSNSIEQGSGPYTLTLGVTGNNTFAILTGTTARTLVINAAVAGASGKNFVLSGGNLTLNRVNTFAGNTTISGSTPAANLTIGSSGQLGSGSYAGTISIASGCSFIYGSSANQTLIGLISGAGALTKNTSSSTLTLTNTNTFSGTTGITAGTLSLTGTGSINSSSGITVNGSTARLLQTSSVPVSPAVTLTNGTLTGSGTVNTVNVGAGTGGIVSNNNGVAGASLTIGTLTFNGAATVNTFGNASAAIATTTLATNVAGLVTINPTAASWTTGSTYDLISYGSLNPGGFAQFTLGTVTGKTGRQTATLVDTLTAVAVQIGGTTDFPYWVGDTNSQWDTTTNNNWRLFTAGTYTNFIAADDVLFDDNATGVGPITVNIDAADVATASTTFNNSTKDYVLNSSGGFGVSGSSLTKNGTGNVTFGTANTTMGTTTVNNGTLNQTGGTATSVTTAINNGTLSQSGGTATVGTLQIGGTSAAPGTTAGLTLTGGTFSATTFDVLSSRDNMASNLTIGGTAAVTLPAFPTNAKGAAATATITFDSTTGFLSPVAASATYLPAGTFNNAYLTANGAKFNVPTAKNITIAQVLENAVSPAAVGTLTKDGVGTLTLSGANTFTGTTTINDGILSLGNASALGSTSGITMATGTTLRPTIVGPVTLTAPITTSGSVTIGAPTVAIGNQAFNEFILNGAIGGSGNVTFVNTNNTNQIFTVTLGSACGYSGTTLIDNTGGTAGQIIVKLGVANALPTTTVVTIDGQNGTGSGRYAEINLNGFNQTLAGLTNITRTSRPQRIVNSDVSAAATLTINGSTNTTFSGSLGVNGANGSVSSITIPGSTNGNNFGLTKSGTGTFTLTGHNPFTGATKVSAGILSLGSSLAMFQSPLDTTTSITGDATNGLQTTVTTLTLGGLTGNKNLASVFETTAGGYSTMTALTLNPGTGATPSYSGGIADGAGSMTLTKSGAGTQTLSGANSYTGATSVNAGTLALGANNALPDTAVAIGAATLNAATFTDTLGTLDATASAVINLGAGAALAFADSSAIDWTGGTLNLTGTFVSGSSLKFGSNASGLTPTQLGLISATGFTGFGLDANGYLTASGVGGYSTWAAINAIGSTPAQDKDGDGVNNAAEYVLGGTVLTNDLSKLPAVSTSGGNLLFTFQRDQASIDGTTTVTIQVGTTLLTWPDSYNVPGPAQANVPGVTILKDTTPGFDTVTLSVPQTPDAAKFARLNVVVTP